MPLGVTHFPFPHETSRRADDWPQRSVS
jgi:hypothetical protein